MIAREHAVCGACCYIAYQNERRVQREEAMREEREAQVPVGSNAAVPAVVGPFLIDQWMQRCCSALTYE